MITPITEYYLLDVFGTCFSLSVGEVVEPTGQQQQQQQQQRQQYTSYCFVKTQDGHSYTEYNVVPK
jgi:hypothetical protein